MSNPLLKPNDPRFSRPPLTDGEGKNRFGDPGQETAPTDAPTQPSGDHYSATVVASEQPYQPRYETTAPSRGVLLLVLAVVGIGGAGLGMTSLSGLAAAGWIFPLCATVVSMSAWLLARSDLRAMRHGGRDEAGRPLTLVAMWLGIAGLAACVGSVGAMIWLGLSLLPGLMS
ncbi:MAG: hypothetical protein WD872_18910 [Pirellulaceae bacterium]